MVAKQHEDAFGAFRILIAEDGLLVQLELLKTPEPNIRGRILTALQELGVVKGVDVNAIDRALADFKKGKQTPIAYGTPPVAGEDGHWELLIEIANKKVPETRLDGSVDFHHLNQFTEVKEGLPLARHRAPKPGVPGIDCFGKEVAARKASDSHWRLGEGTKFDPNDSDYVLAARNGVLRQRGESLSVQEVLVIEGDVDYRTGDIDVRVPVRITQDIKPGFAVRSKSNIMIGGCIQSATVDAGKDLVVTEGILGEPPCTIHAGGSLKAHYVQNANVDVQGDLLVANSVVDCIVNCSGEMEVGEKIVGSQLLIEERLSVETIGSEMGMGSRIFIGFSESERRALFPIFTRHQELARELRQFDLESIELRQESVEAANLERASKSVQMTGEDGGAMRATMQRQAEIQEEIFVLEQRQEAIFAAALEMREKAKVTVKKEVHPGTWFAIGANWTKVQSKLSGQRTIVAETLRRASMQWLAAGSERFLHEMQHWAEPLDLWNFSLLKSEDDIASAARSFDPDFVFLEAKSLGYEKVQQVLELSKDPYFSETFYLVFAEGQLGTLLPEIAGNPRVLTVSGFPTASLMGQIGKRVGLPV